ncbi:hypothetical protein [Clostridium coskatii]|uniref:Uncharacterized protein n=1 Tax=Clostridium coskatii TaxID=1705578 RepID=A0A162KSK9_9CLOT|nr:hypothetical protein [Clostridium coskatii]OAA86342.1 hypothetical protein WX73_02836 [Clostridium coskatii]OAA86360.1 hypothetical protein WX73_02854 [Clostridium coskatii]OBR95073.1 hypothetical protein CLCOS_17780 [Clostridium coskatii]
MLRKSRIVTAQEIENFINNQGKPQEQAKKLNIIDRILYLIFSNHLNKNKYERAKRKMEKLVKFF